MQTYPMIEWLESGQIHKARWRSENGAPPPAKVRLADDRISADVAYRLACEGTALLWRGDYHNARQLLQALGRRVDRNPPKAGASPAESFHLHRQFQARRARILGMLLVPLGADYTLPLRRAPEVRAACQEAWGNGGEAAVVSLRELLGLIGAHEWHVKGVEIPALAGRIHPCYGVYSPVRGEYVDLVASTPLPSGETAFDIGTGTGVLAALLARRGVARVVATDLDPRALACAEANLAHLGLLGHVEMCATDMFPPGLASLIVCNPPWLPVRPHTPVEQAIYDPDSRMLRAFVQGLGVHLLPGGEGWLILSDLAEHLGLRSRSELLALFEAGGLYVMERLDTRPVHPKSRDARDPFYAARTAEVTSLWRLGVAGSSCK